jgi:hypothetical protein
VLTGGHNLHLDAPAAAIADAATTPAHEGKQPRARNGLREENRNR